MKKIIFVMIIFSFLTTIFLYPQNDLAKEKKPVTDKIKIESKFYGKYLYNKSANEKISYSISRQPGKLELKIETPTKIFISQFNQVEEGSILFHHFESLPVDNSVNVSKNDKNLPDEVLLNVSKDRKILTVKQKLMSGETSEITALRFITYFGKNQEIIDLLFPLQKGYKYEYKKLMNGKIEEKNPTITMTIEEKNFSSMGDRYTYAMQLPDGKIVKVSYGKNKSGFFRYDLGGPEEGFLMFPFPLRIDSQWETGRVIKKNDKTEVVKLMRAVVGIDNIIMEDGVFECFKVKESPINEAEKGLVNYIWVAPATGIVQFTFKESNEEQESIYRLIKFSYAGNPIYPQETVVK